MTPPDTLDSFIAAAWSRLTRGIVDPKSAANRPTLATSGPEMRTVVLRAVDQGAATLDIHSHADAGKVAQIRSNPAAALHVWDAKANLQIRMRGQARLEIDTPLAQQVFDAMPPRNQQIYRAGPAPGAVIASPADAHFEADAKFALIRITLEEIELLHLDRTRHTRALYTSTDGWSGRWLVP